MTEQTLQDLMRDTEAPALSLPKQTNSMRSSTYERSHEVKIPRLFHGLANGSLDRGQR